MKLTDPDTITPSDQAKLIAIYERVCPADTVPPDDPRRAVIAAEMLDVGLARTPEDALLVIASWDSHPENIKPIVEGVRRSFRRLKLEGTYSTKCGN